MVIALLKIITIIMILLEKRAMLMNFYLTDDFPALLHLEHPRENWRSQRMKQLMSDDRLDLGVVMTI